MADMEFTGERFCPQVKGEISLEHYLRYLLASGLAAGLDTLDMACGEGYGSSLLAKKAKSVVGVDISPQAIEHAQSTYKAENLSFLEGDAAAIPLPDASVDFVVSFETIEHLRNQEKMLDEIRRVLRPNGLLMLSSPERAANEDAAGRNPFHERELYKAELEEMIRARFSNYAFWGQSTIFASILGNGQTAPLRVWKDELDADAARPDLGMPKYHVLLAANGEKLPDLPLAIVEGDARDSEIVSIIKNNAARKERELLDIQKNMGEYQQMLEKDNKQLNDANATLESDNKTLREENENQRQELEERARRLARAEETIALTRQQLDIVLGSRSWRITAPLRAGKKSVVGAKDYLASQIPVQAGKLAKKVREISGKKKRILLISASPADSGHVYRMERLKAALESDYLVDMIALADLDDNLWKAHTADIVWIWRAEFSPRLEWIVESARARGAKVIYDVDDMCFHPSYFTPEYMDAIRHQRHDLEHLRKYGEKMHHMAQNADFCCATTQPLARELYYKTGKPAFVLRNTYDSSYRLKCVSARRDFLREKTDDFIRIGYAAGTVTHQADFAQILPVLIRILRQHPQCRLVLFKSLDLSEMEGMDEIMPQVELRDIVPWPDLPLELARFDINIAPLQRGNLFCECKSELKFFESALMAVPTVASDTEPFRQAILQGVTGFLAQTSEDWHDCLEKLINDPDLRQKMGAAARRAVGWRFGPDYLRQKACGIIKYAIGDAQTRSGLFSVAGLRREKSPGGHAANIPVSPYDVVFSSGPATSRVAVVIPLYNYQAYIEGALDSLLAQTLERFDVIVVDDASADNSRSIAQKWLENHKDRFASASLLANRENSGLSIARNNGIDYADSEFIMLLDADNLLLPDCLAACSKRLENGHEDFVYPKIETFDSETGEACGLRSDEGWNPARLRHGNYIDAMAMIRKSAWAAAGGFTVQKNGWEDYDFWCKFVELGFNGGDIPEVLARYRVHPRSMLQTVTNRRDAQAAIKEDMAKRHGWLNL